LGTPVTAIGDERAEISDVPVSCPGENIIERTINEMLSAGRSAREINEAIRAIERHRTDK
jgi:hypothetical protein